MKSPCEIRFIAATSKSKLTEGKTYYQGQLQHNAVLSEKETKRLFAEHMHLPEPMTTMYVDSLTEFIAACVAQGYRLDFGGFSVGLKLRGRLPSSNAPYDAATNSLSVEMTPGRKLKDATACLKPVNIAAVTKWNIGTNIQESPFEATDEMAAANERILTAIGYFPTITPTAEDEGVWVADDKGERLCSGEVLESEFGHVTYRFTEPLEPGHYWLTISGRCHDDPALIHVRRRITVR
ncbi:MAG: hypothetical protein MJ240_03450 [Kiritimatiellae bacterium]|nr:hypothetical protein [Kiritimatiellia bacterium]